MNTHLFDKNTLLSQLVQNQSRKNGISNCNLIFKTEEQIYAESSGEWISKIELIAHYWKLHNIEAPITNDI